MNHLNLSFVNKINTYPEWVKEMTKGLDKNCPNSCEAWTRYYQMECASYWEQCKDPWEILRVLRPDYEVEDCFTAMKDVKKTYCEKNRNDQKLVLFCANVLPPTTPKPTTTTLAPTTVAPDCSAAYLVAIGGCILCCLFACVLVLFISRHQSKKYQVQAQAQTQVIVASPAVSKAKESTTKGTTGTTVATTTGTTTKQKEKKKNKKQ